MGRSFKKRNHQNFWTKLGLTLNGFAILLLILSYIAPQVDPKSFWPIAFLGLSYLPLLFINLVFIFIWLFKRPAYSLLSFIAIICGFSAFQSHIGLSINVLAEAIPEKDSSDLRLMSYNVRLFRDLESPSDTPTSQDSILSIISQVKPDVICFQEYYSRESGAHNITELIENKLEMPHNYRYAAAKNNFDSYGMAIFSKFPILNSGVVSEFEKGVNSIIYVDILYNSDTIRIYNTHLRSFGFQKEDYDFIKKSSASLEEDVIFTRRIGSRLKNAFKIRSEQAQAFRKHLETVEMTYIIAGDFNDTPLSFSVNHITSHLKNGFKEKGNGWGKTYTGDFPSFQIDYIFSTNDWHFRNYKIMRRKLSDHYPIWADLYKSE